VGQPVPPATGDLGRLGQRALEHGPDQLGLARQVAVERHLRIAQVGRDPLHRDGRETLGVGDRDSRLGDLVEGERRLGAAGRPGALRPEEVTSHVAFPSNSVYRTQK
jgi:hypothetical protein